VLPRSGLVRSGPVCVGPTIKLVQSRTGPEFDRSVRSGLIRPTADRQVYLFWQERAQRVLMASRALPTMLGAVVRTVFFESINALTSVGAMYKYSKFVIICRGEGDRGRWCDCCRQQYPRSKEKEGLCHPI